MIRLAFSFPAGRYHATPWGRHVNEGAVEWPPSPWRLLRALIATGFAKLGWSEVTPDGRSLIAALAERPPTYWLLPEVTSGHTRHYMPDGAVANYDKKKDVHNRGTDLVIDAFVVIPRERVGLVVEWDAPLSAESTALLARLADNLSHLGRAEAWIEAAVVADVPKGLQPCRLAEAPPGPGWERVELLAPLAEPAFQDWRATWLVAAGSGEAREPGKKKVEPKKKDVLVVPATLVDALEITTGALQKDGWSQPPGSRWLGYWRHPNSIVERPSQREPRQRVGGVRPTTALLALASDTTNSEVLPRLTEALWQGEVIHDALIRMSADEATRRAPESLTGKDALGQPLTGHRHAHVLPLTLDKVGRFEERIDHVLVHAAMGFDPDALRGIQRLRHTFAKGLPTLYVTLVGLGDVRDLGRRVGELASAEIWVSRTPFVPPRHLKDKGKDSIVGQIRSEFESRGLPSPLRIEVEVRGGEGEQWLDAERFPELLARLDQRRFKGELDADWEPLSAGLQLAPRWRHFRRARRDEAKAPARPLALGLRVVFPTAVRGPIALGYGAHFGLGLMRPVRQGAESVG